MKKAKQNTHVWSLFFERRTQNAHVSWNPHDKVSHLTWPKTLKKNTSSMKITTCLQPLSTTGCTLRFSGSSVGTWHLGVDHVASVPTGWHCHQTKGPNTGKQWQWQIKVNHRLTPPWNMLVQPIVYSCWSKAYDDILLMLQTSGCHQLEVGSLCPPKLSAFLYSWVVQDLFHQQYFHFCSGGVFSKGLFVKIL